ncbi:HIR complex subunit, partial [Coniosporium uncinatum]
MAAKFETGELGYPAAVSKNEEALSKFGAGRKAGIVEGTDALMLEESSKAGELKGVQGRMGELMGDGASHAAPLTNGTTPHTNGTSAFPATTTNGTNATPTPAPPQQAAQDVRVNKLKQRVTIGPDGKKRIAPLLVSSSAGLAESSLPQSQLVQGAAQGMRSDAPHNVLDLSKPYDGFPKGGLAALLVGNKRKFADIDGDHDRRIERRMADGVRDGGAPIVMNGTDGLIPPSMAVPKPTEIDIPGALRPAIVSPALTVSQVRLAIPMVRSVILRTVDGSEPPKTAGPEAPINDDTTILEARNASGPSRTGRPHDRDPTRITCTKSGQSLWQDYLPKAVLLLTGNSNFWAAACEDGSMHVWTPAGRRLLNPLILEAQPVIIDCRGWWLLAISAIGMCHVWNIKTLSAPHPPISVAPILDIALHAQGPHLTPSPGIVFARLNTQGRIVVAMSNGDGYTYSPTMFVWQRLSEPWWAVGSQYWNTTDSSVTNVSSSNKDKPPEEDDQVA